jgi:phosphoribosylformylglycinamidine cyclo-ligase
MSAIPEHQPAPGRYDRRGVSAGKEDVHAAISRLDRGLFPQAFCKVLPDLAADDPDYATILHADTAGTKTALAYLYWRETGLLDVWAGIAQDALVMNLDDMACAGATGPLLISSTIGRNKHLIPGEVLSALIDGTAAFLDRMSDLGFAIHHGGGETADVGDIVRTADVGFTVFARLRRDDVFVNRIKPGATIVSLASHGQTTYEEHYNGGMGSNGLSSARHDLFHPVYRERYPETIDPNTDPSVLYTGPFQVTDAVPTLPHEPELSSLDMGRLVLSPTRTYLPFLREALKRYRSGLQGLIHCTGGGQTKVLPFLQGVRVVKENLFDPPPLFRLIRETSATPWKEMYRVFNMGQRLECYAEPGIAQDLVALAAEWNIEARISGYTEASEQPEVVLDLPQGRLAYP